MSPFIRVGLHPCHRLYVYRVTARGFYVDTTVDLVDVA